MFYSKDSWPLATDLFVSGNNTIDLYTPRVLQFKSNTFRLFVFYFLINHNINSPLSFVGQATRTAAVLCTVSDIFIPARQQDSANATRTSLLKTNSSF